MSNFHTLIPSYNNQLCAVLQALNTNCDALKLFMEGNRRGDHLAILEKTVKQRIHTLSHFVASIGKINI